MPTVGLDHFNIRVSPAMLPRIRDFYIEALGLVEGPRPPLQSIGHWLYADSRPVLHLSVTRDDQPPAANAGGTLDHVAFACTGFDAMCRKLDSMSIEYRISEVPILRQRQIFFYDPTGNGVELNFQPGDST